MVRGPCLGSTLSGKSKCPRPVADRHTCRLDTDRRLELTPHSPTYHDRDIARIERNCALCPKTTSILERVIGKDKLRMAGFSALLPRTWIEPHTGYAGYSESVLRAHLCMILPEGADRLCKLTVAGQVRRWEVGKWLIFDDSLEHVSRWRTWLSTCYNLGETSSLPVFRRSAPPLTLYPHTTRVLTGGNQHVRRDPCRSSRRCRGARKRHRWKADSGTHREWRGCTMDVLDKPN